MMGRPQELAPTVWSTEKSLSPAGNLTLTVHSDIITHYRKPTIIKFADSLIRLIKSVQPVQQPEDSIPPLLLKPLPQGNVLIWLFIFLLVYLTILSVFETMQSRMPG
jgi:hypothetical protein